MASIQILLHQERTSDPQGYKLSNTILDGTGQTVNIQPELFVFRYVNGTADIYQHVATVADVDALPAKGDTGWNINGVLYRDKVATLYYSDIIAAEEAAANIKTRLDQLAKDYGAELDPFETTNNYTYYSVDHSISITLREIGSQLGAESYQIASSFPVLPTGITNYLFVYEYHASTPHIYKRVATVDDIETLPEQGGVGWNVENALYRKTTATEAFSTVTEAQAHDRTIQTDMEALPEIYHQYLNHYEGAENTYFYS